MLRLRAIIVWLVMLALPLQGYAAAAMVYCEPEGASSQASPDSAPHDHASHDHATDASETAEHVDPFNAADGSLAQGGDAGGSAHACGACGNCGPCHAIALISALPVVEGDRDAQGGFNAPADGMVPFSPDALEKPPRA